MCTPISKIAGVGGVHPFFGDLLRQRVAESVGRPLVTVSLHGCAYAPRQRHMAVHGFRPMRARLEYTAIGPRFGGPRKALRPGERSPPLEFIDVYHRMHGVHFCKRHKISRTIRADKSARHTAQGESYGLGNTGDVVSPPD